MTYAEKLKDPRWQKIRLKVFERDDWECQACSDRSSPLHVHHLWYEKGLDPWDYPTDSLETLCEYCHARETEWKESDDFYMVTFLRRLQLGLDWNLFIDAELGRQEYSIQVFTESKVYTFNSRRTQLAERIILRNFHANKFPRGITTA
jgi:hypothetical protein